MWQDYVGIVPGIAAAAMGIVTMATQEMRRWQKITIVALTIIAVGATGFSQWWVLHEKGLQEAQRRETLEMLGSLIGQGQSLMNGIVAAPGKPLPLFGIQNWLTKSQTFLKTLGNSFVTRFNSPAGLGSYTWPNESEQANNILNVLQQHVIRLHEFSAEVSGGGLKVSTSF
jgi:hypothetical protein